YDQFALGQKIKVKGQNTPYNGLNEIATIDSIEIIEEGVSIQPVELEMIPSEEELLALQCSVVKMTLTLVSGTLGSKQNAIFKDANDNQITLRGDSDWGTVDSMALRAGGQYTIIGFVSWYNGPQISNLSNYPFVEAVVTDETIAMDYLDQIHVESTATENFDLPSLEGITWSMKETTVAELVGGTVNIIRGEADVIITLVATYTLNGKGYDREFDVVIKKQFSGNEEWTLVTDESKLNAGDTIVIVAKDSDVALSTTQNSNNRSQTNITKSDNIITIDDTVQILTLIAGTKDGTFGFDTGSGYLYAASSSSNYLRTDLTLSDNSSWMITIDETGVAKVVAQGSNTRNLLKYNSTSSIFSCYASGQKDISIYKLTASTPLTDEQIAQNYLNNLSVIDETSDNITLTKDENLSWQLNTITDVASIVDGVLVVTPGDTDVTITLVAVYTLNGKSFDKEFEIVIKKKVATETKTFTETFTDKNLATSEGNFKWTSSIPANGIETSGSARGLQFGANKGSLTLSAVNTTYAIKKITLVVSTNGTANANSIALTIGTTNMEAIKLKKENNYEISFELTETTIGNLIFTINDVNKSVYIKSITIDCE
ncbi:MAG: hypothetical protein NC090_07210, partial [Anaeroplasma bactoclasticum]|nr:hypothetical protein [Anaeroplasma bactoclasticum]